MIRCISYEGIHLITYLSIILWQIGFLRRLVKFHEDNIDETVQHYFDDYAVRVDHYGNLYSQVNPANNKLLFKMNYNFLLNSKQA